MQKVIAASGRIILSALSCTLMLDCDVTPAFSAAIPAGPDFQVNTYTTGTQYFSTAQGRRGVAQDSAGNFVVVWVTAANYLTDVFGQRFDRDGAKLGTEFQVNTYTTGMQGSEGRPDLVQLDVAMAPTGEFVVVWPSDEQDGDASGIFARRYDATGAALGSEFQVNLYTTGTQEKPSIAEDGAGNFVVVWTSQNQDGDGLGLFGRLFDADGSPTSSEFAVNTVTSHNQQLPMVARDDAGDFVVAWTHQTPTGDYDIHARRFDTNGTPATTEFLVNDDTANRQWFGDVAIDGAANFMVVWGAYPNGSYQGVLGKRFDSTGTPIGSEFSLTPDVQYVGDPAISMVSDGRFILTYHSSGPEDRVGIFARRFDAGANPIETRFLVNDYLFDYAISPSAVMDDNGSFVIAWNSDRDGSGGAVSARRFCDSADASCQLCPGFDDSIDDDGDGIPNGCDPCTMLDAGQAMERTYLRVAFTAPGPKVIPAKADSVRLRGTFTLAGPPGAFALLQPVTDGMHVRIESAYGDEVAQLDVPGGTYAGSRSAGWQQRSDGWRFVDTTLPIDGVRKVTLTDQGAKAPNQVSITLKATADRYAVGATYIPLHAIITLGSESAGDAGLCGEATFSSDQCKTSGAPIVGMKCTN